MKFAKNILAATAALTMVSAPVVAQAATAERTAAPVKESEELMGGNFLIIGLAVAAIIAGIVIISGDDEPDSP